ncbi:MAG: AraC family transcriptional regulator [Thalassolituus sp.]
MTLRSILALSFTAEQIHKKYGVDPAPALARAGINPDQIDAAAVISQADELAVLSELYVDLRHDPLAAMKLSSTFGLSAYGAFAMMLMSCSTVLEGIQLGIRYQELSYLFSRLDFEVDGDQAALVLHPYHVPENLHRFIIDRDVAGTFQFLNMMQTMLGQPNRQKKICIPYPEPFEADFYRDTFGCPVDFGADVARFVFNAELLNIPLPNANPTALTLYRQQCDELLKQRRQPETNNLSERVKKYLEMFREGYPSISECADTFSTSERSFRRQLKEEGATYQQLLDTVRSDKACRLLDTTEESVENIAGKLGYTEAAAFIRAFKKWHGMTPAQYRKR